jgi:serine protease Do
LDNPAANGDLHRIGNGTPLTNQSPSPTTPPPLTIPEIAALRADSVVEVYCEIVSANGRILSESAGSGVIITKDGYIVTNNHVIENATKIRVKLTDGTGYQAELVGRDSKTDIAVIKIELGDEVSLSPAEFGDSDEVVVGELAVAIGNSLGTLGGTVTEGIISAINRYIEVEGHFMTLFQTSASVNQGNSGGGLFNAYGELIAIVNAKSIGEGIEGIGFAIPANVVKEIVVDLMEYGYVVGRVALGASLVDILDSWTALVNRVSALGVYVSQAEAGSPLRNFDRITHIDGVTIRRAADVYDMLNDYKPGDTMKVTIVRSGQTAVVDLVLKQATN